MIFAIQLPIWLHALKSNNFVDIASRGTGDIIQASHSTGLGDKGNPQVTKELDKLGKSHIVLKKPLCINRHINAD